MTTISTNDQGQTSNGLCGRRSHLSIQLILQRNNISNFCDDRSKGKICSNFGRVVHYEMKTNHGYEEEDEPYSRQDGNNIHGQEFSVRMYPLRFESTIVELYKEWVEHKYPSLNEWRRRSTSVRPRGNRRIDQYFTTRVEQ